jgi:hypothetical protein
MQVLLSDYTKALELLLWGIAKIPNHQRHNNILPLINKNLLYFYGQQH